MPNSVAAEISRDDEGVTTVTFKGDTPSKDVFDATWDWAQKGTDPFIFVINGVRYLVQPAKPTTVGQVYDLIQNQAQNLDLQGLYNHAR